MAKTIHALVAIVLILVLLSSCSSNTPSTPGAANTPTVNSTYPALAALVDVPSGTFTQTDGVSSFSHTITAFKIGKYEVSYQLWYTVYQWAIIYGYTFQNPGKEGSCCGNAGAAPTSARYEPVTTINWRDMIVWCNAYSQMTGLMLVYYSDSGFTNAIKDSTDGVFGSSVNTAAGSYDNPYVNWAANGYRLPTEGEWQYAASYKDGSSWTPYNYASGAIADYSNTAATGLVAWYGNNSGLILHDVGGKKANALGIYDMSGNITEWCFDWNGSYPGISTDYRGPASGCCRMIKGGCYFESALNNALGWRGYVSPFTEDFLIGFRVARSN